MQQVVDVIRGVHNNFPGLLEAMHVSADDEKKWLREKGVELPAGMTTADIGVMSTADPRIQRATEVFATKLFLALFYFQTETILPPEGRIAFKWATNEKSLDESFPKDVLAPVLQGFPELQRANTSLRDQFFYRFGVADTKMAAAFLAFFNQSLALLGFVFTNPENVTAKMPERAAWLSPFVWPDEGR
ncbi:MAG TPA: hypothetical protein VFE23_15805 [Usitatibacter sp.]|jgi:hypothetical protein|nr:hypothetical protein [Usitatibacter sp.]